MKKILFTMAAFSLAAFAYSQDFGFGDSMGEAGDSGSFEEASAPALAITGEVGAEARAWIGTPAGETTALYNTKGYWKPYDASKTDIEPSVYSNLDLNYEGDYTGANLKLKLNSNTLGDYREDIIDELYANGSFKDGRFQVKAGKIKEVWGKGDKIHVLDNFNANDYTDFIFPDYIDRRIGEVMFKATANLSWDYNIKLEGIYTPWMTADRFATSGYLYPAAQAKLTDIVSGIVKHNAALDLAASLPGGNFAAIVDGLQAMTSFSADQLYADNIRSLKYGQAGVRLTGSLGGIDWGASYYYGHYKQPTANLGATLNSISDAISAEVVAVMTDSTKLNATDAPYLNALVARHADEITETVTALMTSGQASDLAAARELAVTAVIAKYVETEAMTYLTTGDQKVELPSLNYDQLQVFGLEAAFVLWKLNTRWEVAYNLTEDIAGDNPWIKNNSIAWVAGFDIDLPIHNLNINIQENGSYVLKSDKIKDGDFAEYDTDYKSDEKYYNNKLIVLLSDKWLNEKLTTEVQGIWGIERKEFMVAPKIEYNVSEGLTFAVRGVYLYSNNEDGEFYNFTSDSENHDKAFLQLTAKYQF